MRAERFASEFAAGGVRFRVTDNPAAAAAGDPAREGERTVALAVDIRNLRRKGFNPAALDYRLSAAGGGLYSALRSTAVGSDSLVETGTLPEGESVEQALLFRVPQESRRLALEFEPEPDAATRIRVSIGDAG